MRGDETTALRAECLVKYFGEQRYRFRVEAELWLVDAKE